VRKTTRLLTASDASVNFRRRPLWWSEED